MNQGKFISSINESATLLKKFKLLKRKGEKGNGNYSDEFLKVSKGNNIVETYKCAIKNGDYDFLLNDESILQFQKNSDDLRYAFIQNPYNFISKDEYVTLIYTAEDLEELSEFSIEEMVDENEYEQFLNEQSLNSVSNYFRYDCSPAGYRPLVHSHSHFHIGMNENVRIASSKMITPLKFTKFCIKNTYYENWKSQFELDPNFAVEVIKMKNDCLPLSADKWDPAENNDLHLT